MSSNAILRDARMIVLELSRCSYPSEIKYDNIPVRDCQLCKMRVYPRYLNLFQYVLLPLRRPDSGWEFRPLSEGAWVDQTGFVVSADSEEGCPTYTIYFLDRPWYWCRMDISMRVKEHKTISQVGPCSCIDYSLRTMARVQYHTR